MLRVCVRIGPMAMAMAMASTACLPSTPTQAFRESRYWIPTKCERAYIAPYQANLCNSSCDFSLNYACTRQHVGSNWVSLERRGGLKTANWRTQLWSQLSGASSSQQGGALMTVNSLAGPRTVMMASALFTFATAFVVPFYTTMIIAPRWEWTKKLADSNFPYVILGALYIYLLSLSWTSETLPLMFASKHWLPELPGITRMFSSTMTVASAWIHLLAADLYCGRHVYLDGLHHNVETRHSLILCLMVCPIGIFCHMVTKQFTLFVRRAPGDDGTEVATVLV